MNLLHRNQEELESIRDGLVRQCILLEEEAADLVYHLGDIIDCCVEVPKAIQGLRDVLDSACLDPKKSYERLNSVFGLMRHELRPHVRKALVHLKSATRQLSQQHPAAFPWAHADPEESGAQ